MNHREIAQSGYDNEDWIVNLINYNRRLPSVRALLTHIGWNPYHYDRISAYRKGGTGKADIAVDMWMIASGWPDTQYISCKKMEHDNHNGLGHVHKTTVISYQMKWNFDDIIKRCLNVYCGNIIHEGKAGLYFEHKYYDPYRIYISNFFSRNIDMIMSDLFKGRGYDKPQWFTVTVRIDDESKTVYLFDINDVIEYAKGDRRVYYGKNQTKQNLCIGNVMMYSKRSDGQLQFKMNYKPMLKALAKKARIFYF
jgi:hypothetical protein